MNQVTEKIINELKVRNSILIKAFCVEELLLDNDELVYEIKSKLEFEENFNFLFVNYNSQNKYILEHNDEIYSLSRGLFKESYTLRHISSNISNFPFDNKFTVTKGRIEQEEVRYILQYLNRSALGVKNKEELKEYVLWCDTNSIKIPYLFRDMIF